MRYQPLKKPLLNIEGSSDSMFWNLAIQTRGEPVKYYLPMEDIFDVIDLSHIAVGRGGRDRLKVETSRKYANITTNMINIFSDLNL